jgi:tRNA threonylcarbamoyladenosine biosynthesis protein TsaE
MIILDSADATQAHGETWAPELVGGEVIALSGVIGSGKTQLVKGLARGLGYTGEVTSPTFTLVHEYKGGRLTLFHLDLYRLQSQYQAVSIGLEEYLPYPGAVTVIEWPEQIAGLLPRDTRHWRIEVASLTERTIRCPNDPIDLPMKPYYG